jgi:hypothetical protein
MRYSAEWAYFRAGHEIPPAFWFRAMLFHYGGIYLEVIDRVTEYALGRADFAGSLIAWHGIGPQALLTGHDEVIVEAFSYPDRGTIRLGWYGRKGDFSMNSATLGKSSLGL